MVYSGKVINFVSGIELIIVVGKEVMGREGFRKEGVVSSVKCGE